MLKLSIANSKGFSAQVAFAQIPASVKYELGARDAVDAGDQLWFRIGNRGTYKSRVLLKVFVTLNEHDLYDVTLGTVTLSCEIHQMARLEDIDAENLGDAILAAAREIGACE